LAKPNYRQAKRQKEISRMARQAEKLKRRSGKPDETGEPAAEATAGEAVPTTEPQTPV
jgi:hypothetical protein